MSLLQVVTSLLQLQVVMSLLQVVTSLLQLQVVMNLLRLSGVFCRLSLVCYRLPCVCYMLSKFPARCHAFATHHEFATGCHKFNMHMLPAAYSLSPCGV